MKRQTFLLSLVLSLTCEAAACGTGTTTTTDKPGPETSPPVVQTADVEGTLLVESSAWAKDQISPPHRTQIDVTAGTTGEFGDGSFSVPFEVTGITVDSVTLNIGPGVWMRGEHANGDSIVTLHDGETVSFETASEDAGMLFEVTFHAK